MNKEWKEMELGELVTLQGGYAFPSKLFKNKGIPIIRISNIKENGIGNNFVFLSKNFFNKHKDFALCNNDILIAMSGATTGKNCQIKEHNLPALLNQRTGRFIIKSNQIDNTFLYNFIKTDYFQNIILIDAIGGAQPNISSKEIEKIKIKFPPLPQQKKIANILSTCDRVIEKTEQAIAKYQALKQGMMQDLFARGIDPKTGKLRPSYLLAPHLYKKSPLGFIPLEWEVEELGVDNITYAGGTPNRRVEKYYNGHIPWVSSGEVNQEFIYKTKEYITQEALNNSSAKLAPKESVLVALYGATAGQISMLKIEACTNQAVLCIITNYQWYNYYIYYLLKHFKRQILFLAQGSGQPNLSKGMIDTLKIPKPTIKEQTQIAQKLESIDQKIALEQEVLVKYQQLKAGLMQDLLTAKVLVSV